MRHASREEAVAVLRAAGGEVRMRVLRPDRPLDRTLSEEQEDYFDVFTVELVKKKSKGLGLSIVGRQLPGSRVLVHCPHRSAYSRASISEFERDMSMGHSCGSGAVLIDDPIMIFPQKNLHGCVRGIV